MNKARYRIVFNHIRSALMVVGEAVRSAGKESGRSSDGAAASTKCFLVAGVRPVVFSLWAALGFVYLPASAQVVADPTAAGTERPTVMNAPNGVPLVNIQTPSEAGVSRNVYSQFDVQQQGAILNNSRTSVATQQGGWVQGNPWLAKGSARVILNEVNSSNPSALRGYVEVAGQRAQVIIANPAGISCDGCGFINANRATLTTGKPIMNGGSLEGYRVQRGRIEVKGAGMDASGADYADLIARAVEVNAGIWAKEVNVVAGTQTVAHAEHGAPQTGDHLAGTDAAPKFAVDVAQLGGMYAGKIFLVGTEAGVGVRNAGEIGAGVGEVVITADGQIVNAGTVNAAGDVAVHSNADVDNRGNIYARGSATVRAKKQIDNQGSIAAAEHAQAIAQYIASGGLMAAGLNSEGQLSGEGTLNIQADNVRSWGTQLSAGDLQLSADNLDLTGANSFAGGTLHAGAADKLVFDAGSVSAARLNIEAGSISNVGGLLSQWGNAQGQIRSTGGFDNQYGQIESNGQLLVRAMAMINNRRGVITAQGGQSALSLLADDIDNSDGRIVNFGEGLTYIKSSGKIINRNEAGTEGMGLIGGNQDVLLEAAVVNNQGGGQILSANTLALATAVLDNTDASIHSNTDLVLIDPTLTVLNVRGQMSANNRIELTLANLDNTDGQISTAQDLGGDVAITLGGTLTNLRGRIGADRDAQVNVMRLEGIGQITAGRDTAVHVGSDYTYRDTDSLAAGRNISLSADGTLINETELIAAGALSVSGVNVHNHGKLAAGGLLSAQAQNNLTNTGILLGASVLAQAGDTVLNEGQDASILGSDKAGRIELLAKHVINRDPTTATSDTATTRIEGLGDIVIAGGIDADQNYTSAADIQNVSARIISKGDMTLVADALTNTRRVFTTSSTYDEYVRTEHGTVVWTADHPDVIGGRYIEPPHGGKYNSDYVHTEYTGVVRRNRVLEESPGALIEVGGNLTTSPTMGTVTNRWSRIAVTGTSTLEDSQIDQSWGDQARLGEETRYSGYYVYRTYRGWVWDSAWGGASIRNPGDGIARSVSYGNEPHFKPQETTDYDASFTTGKAFIGKELTIKNDAANRRYIGWGQAPGQALGSGQQVTNTLANLSLPTGGLYHTNSGPQARYLVETNAAFTQYHQWLSSDYYYQHLGVNPSDIAPRLGDGFYEQELVKNQLLDLTGKTSLNATDTESQFQAMLEAGAQTALDLGLAPGVSLSAEQAAHLNQDVIIMETRQVHGNAVLVPVVYLSQTSQKDLLPGGALISAGSMHLTNSTIDNGGTIRTAGDMHIDGARIDSRGGALQAGGAMSLESQADIDLTSAKLGAQSLTLSAANNVILDTATQSTQDGARSLQRLAAQAQINTTGDALIQTGNDLQQNGGALDIGGNLTVQTGGDWQLGTAAWRETTRLEGDEATRSNTDILRLHSASVRVGGQTNALMGRDLVGEGASFALAGGGLIAAGRDIHLTAATEHTQIDSASHSKRHIESRHQLDERLLASSVSANADLTLSAVQDIQLQAAQLSLTQGTASLVAGRDIQAQAAVERHEADNFHAGNHGHALKKSTLTTRDRTDQNQSVATSISAERIAMQGGQDIAITGSQIVATQNLDIAAARNVTIAAGSYTQSDTHYRQETKRGVFGNGGLAITIGSQKNSSTQSGDQNIAAASTLGSIEGNLTIRAGSHYQQTGSELLTPGGSIDIAAQSIHIQEAREHTTHRVDTKFNQGGVSLSITGGIVSAIQTADQMRKAAKNTSSSRMKLLAAANTALAASDAYGAVKAGQGQTVTIDNKTKDGQIVTKTDELGNATASRDANAADKAGGLNLAISLGATSSETHTQQQASNAAASSLTAGQDIRLTATGAGLDSNLTVQGTDLKAAGNIALAAQNQINLLAAEQTASQTSSNKSKSGAIGISIGTNTGITLSASMARGNADGNDQTYRNTHIDAGNRLTLTSGGDTTVKGAVAKAHQITANVGGDLHIESLQDESHYESKQKSAGGSLTIGVGVSGSLNLAKAKAKSEYLSVQEQSGFFAGDGGFDVNVAGDTTLIGGAITSTDAAIEQGLNSLSTRTLQTSDLENYAYASAKSSGLSFGSGMASQGKYGVAKAAAGNALTAGAENGSSLGETRSVISGARIAIADEAAQIEKTGMDIAQTLASLNRDGASAHTAARAQDVGAMQREAQAAFEIKRQSFTELTKHADELYQTKLDESTRRGAPTSPRYVRVTCEADSEACLNNPKTIGRVYISEEQAIKEGQFVAINGIMNDPVRAAQLAYQNAPVDKKGDKPKSLVLLYEPEMSTAFGELLLAGYEKFLSPLLGRTHVDILHADFLQARGDQDTLSMGHSRGTLVQRNAFDLLAERGFVNERLSVRAVGGALDSGGFIQSAAKVIGNTKLTSENVTFIYLADDPVSVIVGGNPGNVAASLKEFVNVMFKDNSAHSCYETGAKGCVTIANPVLGGPVPTNQNPSLVRVIRGDSILTPTRSAGDLNGND